jgi:predicted benzoate:H+ symporter BenE
MTKKDYATIAQLIAFTQDAYLKGRIDADLILPRRAQFIAEDAKLDHPRFDFEAFLKAAVPSAYSNL